MSKLSKKNKHLENVESTQKYPGPSFEDDLDFFYDILCTPIRTRSKEQCESIACAIQQTRFYKFYEKELFNRQDILYEMAQSMGCECIRMCCKIFDEGQLAKKVYIIMDGEVCILSNLINRETARIPPPPKNVKSAGKKEPSTVGANNQVEIKKKPKFAPKNFETKFPLQEEFMSLKASDFFGDIDLRYNVGNSLSAVTRKNTNCATIPADVFLKFFSEKTKIQEEVRMLKQCEIFKFIPNQFVEYMIRFGTEINMHIGSSVYKEGDIANDVYFIKEGEIEFSMNSSQKMEEERKKLKEIKAKFGENGQQEDGFDEIKFERSSLFHKVLYEKGHSGIKAKQLWSCDDLLKKEISCLSDSKDKSKNDQSFQENGLKVFSQDNKEFSMNKEETAVMTNALSSKMTNAQQICYSPQRFQSVEGFLELNETINGYKLFTLIGGQCFGDEELIKEFQSHLIDPIQSFVPEVLKVLKSINSALLPENYELNKNEKPSNRLMGAQCKSAHCALLKISYKLFMSFVCLAKQELQLHKTLMESSIKAWRQDKIQKHVQQMKESSKQFRSLNAATPIRSNTPLALAGKVEDNNKFGNISDSEKSKLFFAHNVSPKLTHSASGFYKTKCQSEKNILSSSQGLFSMMKSTVDSPEQIKNSRVNTGKTDISFKDDILKKSSYFNTKNTTKEFKLSLLEKVHIPQKKGFKVTLEQEDATAIHSPRNIDQKQITSPQIKPSKFSNFVNNFTSISLENDISGQKQPQNGQINTTNNHGFQANSSQNKTGKFIGFDTYLARRSSSHRLETTQITSKLPVTITTPTTSIRSVGTSLNSPSSPVKNKSKKYLNFTQNDILEIDNQLPDNKNVISSEQQIPKQTTSLQKFQSKLNNPNTTSNSLNCSISFINFGENRFISQRNLKISSDKKEKEECISTKTLADQNIPQQDELCQNNPETHQDSYLKIQRKYSSIFPVKSSSGMMIHSSSKKNFHDLIGQIGKHDKLSTPSKNDKTQPIRLEIFHDFINKKYRKAFNEASTIGQIQLKPQSFLIFGKEGEHLNSQVKGETFLQLQKKHEIEKKFPKSPAAEKINSYFNNKIQSINKQHKDSLQKIKINNKHSNIKLFCDELTKKVIEQEEKERKELEEAGLFFNFVSAGKIPEK